MLLENNFTSPKDYAKDLIGFSGRLLPVLLLQFVCARDARIVIHRLTQPHAHTERHRRRGSPATQCHRQILRHLKRVHSVRLRFCAMHVHLDTGILDTRAVCLDRILQFFRRGGLITLPRHRPRHHRRHFEDGSVVRNGLCSYWNRRSAGLSSLWCYYLIK
jgi:hypothetical protein